MGFSGIGPGSLLLILLIVLLLFGTKRLKNIGGDLGSAIKGFRKSMNDADDKTVQSEQTAEKNSLEGNDSSGATQSNVQESSAESDKK